MSYWDELYSAYIYFSPVQLSASFKNRTTKLDSFTLTIYMYFKMQIQI